MKPDTVQVNDVEALLGTLADPMDRALPCDVTVGHGTMRKDVKLRTLVLRMKTLYEMATGQNADEVANRTPEQRQALAQAFIAKVNPEAAPVAQPGEAVSDERITKHTLRAKDCPPDSKVMLVSSLRRILAAPIAAQPAAAEPNTAEDQAGFHAHIAERKLDTSMHPLHYLFLVPKTYEARQAWKAAIRFMLDRAPAAAPAQAAAVPEAIADVLVERASQDVQWGGPSHDDEHDELDWLGFIHKQSNSIDAALESAEGAEHDDEVRAGFVKIAALAVAAIESIDRKAVSHGGSTNLDWKVVRKNREPATVTDSERMAWLHSTNKDAEGYEYGVAKVRFDSGMASVLWAVSDHSDIDPLILAAKGRPSGETASASTAEPDDSPLETGEGDAR